MSEWQLPPKRLRKRGKQKRIHLELFFFVGATKTLEIVFSYLHVHFNVNFPEECLLCSGKCGNGCCENLKFILALSEFTFIIYIIISKTWHTKRTHTNSNRYILFSQSYSLVDISIESMLLLYSAWMVQKLWISHFPVPILSHPHSHNFHSDLVGGSVELSSFRFCRSHSLACLFRAIPKSHRISIHLSSENG